MIFTSLVLLNAQLIGKPHRIACGFSNVIPVRMGQHDRKETNSIVIFFRTFTIPEIDKRFCSNIN